MENRQGGATQKTPCTKVLKSERPTVYKQNGKSRDLHLDNDVHQMLVQIQLQEVKDLSQGNQTEYTVGPKTNLSYAIVIIVVKAPLFLQR